MNNSANTSPNSSPNRSTVTCQEIYDRFSTFFTEVLGPLDRKVSGMAANGQGQDGDLIFITNPRDLEKNLATAASALVVPSKCRSLIDGPIKQTVFFSTNPIWIIALIKRAYFAPFFRQVSVHSTAVIAPTAKLGKDVYVGPHCVIEDGAVIGDGSQLHAHAVIGRNSVLGRNCIVQSHSVVGSWGFGYAHNEKGEHLHIPHTGRVLLGDGVELGSHCAIDRGTLGDTVIGPGTIVDNLVHIGHNVKIGKNSMLTANFLAGGSCEIGDNFVAGGRSSVNGHIQVCNNVQLAAHSAIHNDITTPGAYGGFPCVPLDEYKRNHVAGKQLAKMRKNISRLMKTVFQTEV